MESVTIEINLDQKCERCKKGGATPNGLCLKCITRAIRAGEYDHLIRDRVIETLDGTTEAPADDESPGPLFEDVEDLREG